VKRGLNVKFWFRDPEMNISA